MYELYMYYILYLYYNIPNLLKKVVYLFTFFNVVNNGGHVKQLK